jgi:hypothetical protein
VPSGAVPHFTVSHAIELSSNGSVHVARRLGPNQGLVGIAPARACDGLVQLARVGDV